MPCSAGAEHRASSTHKDLNMRSEGPCPMDLEKGTAGSDALKALNIVAAFVEKVCD